LAFLLAALIIWQAVTALRWLPSYAFPSPAQVVARLWELAVDGQLWPSVRASVIRMALASSCPRCSAADRWRWARASWSILTPVRVPRAADTALAAWVPISLLIFGLSDAAIYFVIIMSSTAAMAIATADGIAHIPPVFVRGRAHPRHAAGDEHAGGAAGGAARHRDGIKLGWTLGWHGSSPPS